jgi:uncharacterized protein YdeI (BOF family)
MRKYLFPMLVAGLVLATAVTAFAVTMSITEAKNAAKDTEVTLSGTITVADGNDYTISDGVDSIKVEFGPVWYKAANLKVGEAVTVTGEIDKGKDGAKAAEVDGFSATKADGTVVTARKGPGKPPWAGQGGRNGKGAKGDTADDDPADDSCTD